MVVNFATIVDWVAYGLIALYPFDVNWMGLFLTSISLRALLSLLWACRRYLDADGLGGSRHGTAV